MAGVGVNRRPGPERSLSQRKGIGIWQGICADRLLLRLPVAES